MESRHTRPAGVLLVLTQLLTLSAPALAQFEIQGMPVQIHGFFSQGFMSSSGNNYLTAPTLRGAFAPTDGGLNVSMRVNERLRVGAQAYSRKLGELGHGKVTLDWAFMDYRVRDWLGVRAGKVKTVYGLYTDTQDMEFLHTWALLPHALYPADLRGGIAHTGADLYGTIPLSGAGSFAYNVYVGGAPSDRDGGRFYGLESYGLRIDQFQGMLAGADLKWTTPVPGLIVGAGRLHSPATLRAVNTVYWNSVQISNRPQSSLVFSAQFTRGRLRIDWERNRMVSRSTATNPYGSFGPPEIVLPYDTRAWYAAAAWRLSKRFEIGSYHSRYYPQAGKKEGAGAAHVIDHAATVRVDLFRHWDLKTEGHFIDGFGDPGTSRGFYPQNNVRGLRHRTNLLVIRLGFNW